VAVASAGPYASHLHFAPDRYPRQHQHLITQVFTGRIPFQPPNQQRQSTEGIYVSNQHFIYSLMEALGMKLRILALIWTITGEYI